MCVYVCRAITVNLNIVVEDTFSKLTSLEIVLKRAKEKKLGKEDEEETEGARLT